MNRWSLILMLAVALAFPACATKSFSPDTAPEYSIIRAFSPFYKNGPLQGGGPNASLVVGTRVKMLRDEMGFSLVLLEDGRTGYVANENMAVAPPRPPAPAVSGGAASTSSGTSKKRRGAPNSPAYTGEQLNDIPLPDPNVPPPDLNVAPEDVMAPAPTPNQSSEKPKFRY